MRGPAGSLAGMTFDETVKLLSEQRGRYAEVSVSIPQPDEDEGNAYVAAFTGAVRKVQNEGGRGVCLVWLEAGDQPPDGPPSSDVFRMRRDLFDSGEVVADVVQDPEERRESGSTWTLTIRQGPALTEVLFSV